MDRVDELLNYLDKERLAGFIRKECKNDLRFQDRFLALGAGTVFKPNPDIYASRVKDLIDDYGGRHGYIQYRDTFNFNRAVRRILAETDEAMQKCQWEVAIAVLSGIASVSADILNSGDDSAGELGAIVSECFEKWHELSSNESVPVSLKSEMFEYALARFNEEDLKGWDWWWDWIAISIRLAETPTDQSRVIQALDAITPQKGDRREQHYYETAQKFKLDMMSRCGREEDQIKFMYDNVSHSTFRNRLIQIAWNRSDFSEALRLAKDGVTRDAKNEELVREWRKCEYRIYCKTGDISNQLQLARYFFFAGGGWGEKEFSMETIYSTLKSLIPPDEWPEYVKTLIKEVKNKRYNHYLPYIYTQEKMWEEYMKYLRKDPSLYEIEEAPQEVREAFSGEIIRLYAMALREFFIDAGNRESYRQGVDYLRTLIQYGGEKEAEQIAEEQRSRTPRRPALIDELSKL